MKTIKAITTKVNTSVLAVATLYMAVVPAIADQILKLPIRSWICWAFPYWCD